MPTPSSTPLQRHHHALPVLGERGLDEAGTKPLSSSTAFAALEADEEAVAHRPRRRRRRRHGHAWWWSWSSTRLSNGCSVGGGGGGCSGWLPSGCGFGCSRWRGGGVATMSTRSRSRSLWRRLSVPVVGVFALFASIYGSTMRCTILRWTPTDMVGVHATVFTACTAVSIVMYVAAFATDPGGVPPAWTPSNADVHEVKRKGGARRFCQKCHAFKPPRSHHCRRCGRCVLKMDHHCLWLNTCVGFGNYARFLLFMSSTTMSLIYVVVAVAAHLRALTSGIARARHTMPRRELEPGKLLEELHDPFRISELLVIAGTSRACVVTELGFGLLSLCLAAAIGGLLTYHVYLVSRNMTTIEYYEGIRTTSSAQAAHNGSGAASPPPIGSRRAHVYDLGLVRNFGTVFAGDAMGDGTSFPTSLCPRAGDSHRDAFISV